MAEQWNETPDYRTAHAEYVQKMTQAIAEPNPEIAKLQADNWWLGRQAEIRDAHFTQMTARSALDSALAQAKAARPDVPEAVWAIAQTPEALQNLLAALPAAQQASSPKAPPRPRPAAAPPTGGPPPSTTSAPNSEPPEWGLSGRKWNDREYLATLIEKANNLSGDGAGRSSKHVDEFIDLFMDNRVFTQMGFNPDGTSAI